MKSNDVTAVMLSVLVVVVIAAIIAMAAANAKPAASKTVVAVAPRARVNYQQMQDMPIDVVFTWCKQTPEWNKERAKHFTETSTKEPRGRNPLTCDHENDCEIHYAVKSVQRFMPWVRKIWIVTQRPQNPNIPGTHVVYHDEILAAHHHPEVLPTFNSHVIESFLHHIPGLAEHFIYFNDDCFVGQSVTPDVFFDEERRPICYTTGAYIFSALFTRPVSPYGFRFAWRNLHKLFKKLYKVKVHMYIHQACALTKTACAEAEAAFPDIWHAVRRTRLRDKHNIPPIGTVLNYGVLRNTVARRKSSDVSHIEVQTDKVHKALRRIERERPQLFCINNIPSREVWATVRAGLDKIFDDN